MNESPTPERAQIVDNAFAVPMELSNDRMRLVPLAPEHNEADHAAWTSSIDHIRSTAGFGPDKSWPTDGMSLERNLSDIVGHQVDFEARTGFTYTVLDRKASDSVIGCVYIYGDPEQPGTVKVRSWVREAVADLDQDLRRLVAAWLDADWPFGSYRYEGLVSPDRAKPDPAAGEPGG